MTNEQMNLQESEHERIVAHVKPGMAPYIAHDLYRLFSVYGCTVAYTDVTVEVSAEYITLGVETWLGDCEHVTHYECQTVNEVREEEGEE